MSAADRDTSSIPPEFAAYLPAIRRRWLNQQAARRTRRQEALVAAQQIAALLKTEFDAREVIAFGSLVHPERFDEQSDIDLAVAGISPVLFFRAWASAGADCPFELDLIDLGSCPPGLLALIQEEGVAL
jgi:hypothetical protein